MDDFPLSILLWLPLAFGLAAALVPAGLAGLTALTGSVGALGITIALLAGFDPGGGLQYVTDGEWVPELGLHYRLGIDGVNVFFLVLTTIVFTAGMLWALRTRDARSSRPRQFWFHLGLAHTAVLGAFLAQDLILFVAFFDLMLVPFFFLAGAWGDTPREHRIGATLKLFVYTLVGSLLMLAAAIATGVLAATDGQISFALDDLRQATLSEGSQQWIFLFFAAAFLVKMPAFPLHGWLRDGYQAMPLPALAIFSGVLSKVAAYGFLRIVLPLYPDATVHFQLLMLILAVASIVYGSAMAFTTTNMRLVLGYSSIAQLGFIVLGIFSLTEKGAQGAILQSVNHGLVVAPAFFIAALLAARAGGSEDLRDMGGIAFRAPVLAAVFLIVAFANLALPGSANFVGEFLILLGTFEAKTAIAIVASVGVVLASVYMLRAFIRSMHERVGESVLSRELSVADAAVLVPLVAVILALALYPQFVLRNAEAGTGAVLQPAAQLVEPPQPARAAPAAREAVR